MKWLFKMKPRTCKNCGAPLEINKNGSLVELMENKLNILGKQLYEENDIQKCENIVQLMNKIIDTFKRYKKIHKKNRYIFI